METLPEKAPATEAHSSPGAVQGEEPHTEEQSSSSGLWSSVMALAGRALQATRSAVVGMAHGVYSAINRNNIGIALICSGCVLMFSGSLIFVHGIFRLSLPD